MALHNPEAIRPENRGILEMKKSDMRDFAETPEKGLPKKKSKYVAWKAQREAGPA